MARSRKDVSRVAKELGCGRTVGDVLAFYYGKWKQTDAYKALKTQMRADRGGGAAPTGGVLTRERGADGGAPVGLKAGRGARSANKAAAASAAKAKAKRETRDAWETRPLAPPRRPAPPLAPLARPTAGPVPVPPRLQRSVTASSVADDDDASLASCDSDRGDGDDGRPSDVSLDVRWPPAHLYETSSALRGTVVTFGTHDWYVCKGGETVRQIAVSLECAPDVLACVNSVARRCRKDDSEGGDDDDARRALEPSVSLEESVDE